MDCKCTIDVTVGAGNLEDVNAHFIDKPGAATPQPDDRLAPPPPPDEWDHAADAENEEPGGGAAPMGTECKGNWRWTGSWDGSDSYTRGWGPEWGDDENPPSSHPLYHSIHGSNNTGTTGKLSIISGAARGWILASFSGAEVLTCTVTTYDGKPLAGKWDLVTQQWAPAKREPTIDAQWFLTITVAKNTCEDVNTHFIDEVREDSWRYTGSWDDPAEPSYTHDWGPAWGKHEHSPSTHPDVYSIKGSDNAGGSGALDIISGEDCGWALVSYSGAYVLGVNVTNAAGETLAGTWSVLTQKWTPSDRLLTVNATWDLTVAVDGLNLEDVNAHFQRACAHAAPPPPPPLPVHWTTSAWWCDGQCTGGAAPPVDDDGNFVNIKTAAGKPMLAHPHPAPKADKLPLAFYAVSSHANVGRKANLTISSAALYGWTKVSMSGAHVVDMTVTTEDGTPLEGLWLEAAQSWTISGSTGKNASVASKQLASKQHKAGGGGSHARPGGGLGNEKPTMGATLTITVKVAEGNAADVAMHFICVMCDMMCGSTAPPPPAPPPPPREDWKFTGSWDKGAYTKGWGPPSGKVGFPASKHPAVYSIKGSINRAATGSLSIIAAECKGWTVISFSGADVQSVAVASASGDVLSGTLSVSTQTWTPYVMSTGRRKRQRGGLDKNGLAMAQLSSTPKPNELTAGATYTVTVTVAEPVTFDDVNAYFVTVPCKEPFKAPHPALPTPEPEEPCDVEEPTPPPPPPASCSDCVDTEPPSDWAEPTCARQLSGGKCAERVRMADGYCMATCGICTPCEEPCDTEEPTAAPTKAPTKAPTMAPTKAPTPSCDVSCADAMPPSTWGAPTCAEQLAGGHCAERISLADGYCEATCGICKPCEVPCPTEVEIPTMAPTRAPTRAPTSAPTPAPEEPCDTEAPVEPAALPTLAPTKAPTPASCSDCVDTEPPSDWAEPTCARQLSGGKCAERVRMADGYCMATCGICQVCPPVDTVHGDPMFKHNGESFKFSIPVGKPTDLLSWGGQGGKKAVLSGTAFERVRTGNQWFDSLALTVGGKEVFNVSVAKVARGSLRMVVDGELMNPSDVDTFTSRDLSTTMVSSIMSKKFKIGHKSAQTLQVKTLGDVRFTVLSAKAAKYDGERGQFDYRHLNVKLDSGMPSGATGIFAELSGAAPITAATKQLLADPLAFDLAMRRARTDGKSIEISGEN